jgi:hypothetical protein
MINFTSSVPLNTTNAYILAIIIIVCVVLANVLQGFIIQIRVNRSIRKLSNQLAEISRQLLVKTGYLQDKGEREQKACP